MRSEFDLIFSRLSSMICLSTASNATIPNRRDAHGSGFRFQGTGNRIAIYDLIDEAPHSVFSRDFWINKLFELCLADESFRAKVFRFIDVFPCLNTSASILRHFQEYLGTYLDRPGVNIPPVLKRIMRSVPPDSRAAAIFARPVAMAIRNIAGQFMVGSDAKDALPRLEKLRSQGIAFTIDLLGETVVSEREADEYLGKYINLLNIFGEMQKNWMPLGIGTGALDWGAAPGSIHPSRSPPFTPGWTRVLSPTRSAPPWSASVPSCGPRSPGALSFRSTWSTGRTRT